MDAADMRRLKIEAKMTWRAIAEATGYSLKSIFKMAYGEMPIQKKAEIALKNIQRKIIS